MLFSGSGISVKHMPERRELPAAAVGAPIA
jgi:hypothetical protein